MTIHFTSGDNGEYATGEDKGFEIVTEYILAGNAQMNDDIYNYAKLLWTNQIAVIL